MSAHACPACYYYSLVEEGDLTWCQKCLHAYQTDLTVTADYAGTYAARTYDTYPETTSQLRAGYVIGVLRGLRGTVLDVGYGNGSFLKLMNKAGFTVRGADVHGMDRGIVEAPLDHPCSVVTFFDSLEHFSDLDDIKKVCAPNVVISIPHRPALFRKYPKQWKHYKPGEHLHYFSSLSLRALMKRLGYVCEDENCMEDVNRGKLSIGATVFDNIHTFHFVKP